MRKRPSESEEREANEAAAAMQRRGSRRLPLEERFRQNDSISRFRVAARASRRRRK